MDDVFIKFKNKIYGKTKNIFETKRSYRTFV